MRYTNLLLTYLLAITWQWRRSKGAAETDTSTCIVTCARFILRQLFDEAIERDRHQRVSLELMAQVSVSSVPFDHCCPLCHYTLPLPLLLRLRCTQDDHQNSHIKAHSHMVQQHMLTQRHCHRC